MLDFRGLIATLEERGELLRIRRPVDPRYEMPALMQQVDGRRRAFLFEQVKGAKQRLVGGLLNRWECYGWVLGTRPGDPFTATDLAQRLDAARAGPIPPRTVATGPVKEVVHRGEQIDLGELPAPTAFEFDSGAFITGGCGFTHNPQTGALNVGIYRTLILGRDRMLVNANVNSDLHGFYEHAGRHGGRMPIALAIGVPPALLIAAVCKPPADQSEVGLAGALQGQPLELVKCETSDLLVPADAEMVIEGEVDCSEWFDNTLGEFVGHYGTDRSPVTRVTAITQRRDAMHYCVMPGRNPEHNTLAGIAGFTFQQRVDEAIRRAVPQLLDLHVYLEPRLGSMCHAVISIDKRDDAEPMAVIAAAFSAWLSLAGQDMPVEKMTKRVIVVDRDVDVHDFDDVEWAIWTRAVDARKLHVLADVPSWSLERGAKPGRGSLRLAVDATCDMEDREKLRRALIPGAANYRLADYL